MRMNLSRSSLLFITAAQKHGHKPFDWRQRDLADVRANQIRKTIQGLIVFAINWSKDFDGDRPDETSLVVAEDGSNQHFDNRKRLPVLSNENNDLEGKINSWSANPVARPRSNARWPAAVTFGDARECFHCWPQKEKVEWEDASQSQEPVLAGPSKDGFFVATHLYMLIVLNQKVRQRYEFHVLINNRDCAYSVSPPFNCVMDPSILPRRSPIAVSIFELDESICWYSSISWRLRTL